jgi:hypothetical protein
MSFDFSLMVCVVAIGKPVAKKAKCQAESTPVLLQPEGTVLGLALDAESQETQMTAADDDVEPSHISRRFASESKETQNLSTE